MDYYVDYVTSKLGDAARSLCYHMNETRKEGGPRVPSDHQFIQLNGIAFNIREVHRCLDTVSRCENPKDAKREVLSIKKKLGYIGDHVNELLNPKMDIESNPSNGVDHQTWEDFTRRVLDYHETASYILTLKTRK